MSLSGPDLQDRCELLRSLHRPGTPLLLPNAWDVATARAVVAAGFPVVVFGVLPLPDFVPADKALAEAIKPLHKVLAWLLALLVLGHVGAALKHHFIDRDGLLARMWPSRT